MATRLTAVRNHVITRWYRDPWQEGVRTYCPPKHGRVQVANSKHS
jgi:hypothetical protein